MTSLIDTTHFSLFLNCVQVLLTVYKRLICFFVTEERLRDGYRIYPESNQTW